MFASFSSRVDSRGGSDQPWSEQQLLLLDGKEAPSRWDLWAATEGDEHAPARDAHQDSETKQSGNEAVKTRRGYRTLMGMTFW